MFMMFEKPIVEVVISGCGMPLTIKLHCTNNIDTANLVASISDSILILAKHLDFDFFDIYVDMNFYYDNEHLFTSVIVEVFLKFLDWIKELIKKEEKRLYSK